MEIISGTEIETNLLKHLSSPPHVGFYHLDWIPDHVILQSEASFALMQGQKTLALLCLQPESYEFGWLRYFYSVQDGQHKQYFAKLLEKGLQWYREQKIPQLYALSAHDWVSALLKAHGFVQTSKIISLSTELSKRPIPMGDRSAPIAEITERDLPTITAMDLECFSAPWYLNYLSQIYCTRSADYATQISMDGRLVAYQVSHNLFGQIHIARLAVHPDFQGRGLAQRLISDLFDFFFIHDRIVFSVNTQAENDESIHLYRRMGFSIDDRSTPVFKLQID